MATLVAGYLAPAVVGVGAAGLLLAGHALGLLWLLVAFQTSICQQLLP